MNEPTEQDIAFFIIDRVESNPREWRFLRPEFKEVLKKALWAFAESKDDALMADDTETVKRRPGRPRVVREAA